MFWLTTLFWWRWTFSWVLAWSAIVIANPFFGEGAARHAVWFFRAYLWMWDAIFLIITNLCIFNQVHLRVTVNLRCCARLRPLLRVVHHTRRVLLLIQWASPILIISKLIIPLKSSSLYSKHLKVFYCICLSLLSWSFYPFIINKIIYLPRN
jgi:hypothetical protein